MKLKNFAFALTCGVYAAAPVHAGCVGPTVMGDCLTNTYVPGHNSDSSNAYEGSSGNRYQYDLGNPSDQVRYSTDLSAQRRDQQSIDVGRDLDRGLGQYGGGIYND